MPTHKTTAHRRWQQLPAVALLIALTAASCGSDSSATESSAAASESTATSFTSTTASATTRPPTTTATTARKTTATTTSTTAATTAPLKVSDLEDDLTTAILETHPIAGPGEAACSATDPLTDWQPIYCGYNPYVPAEYGPIYLSLLDRHRYVWAVGHCCDSGPNPENYHTGLLCRDLLKPPQDSDRDWDPEENHLSYGLAVWYWLADGRPDRMDADHNGIPCETVYPKNEIDAFWASTRSLP
ncbi:MAG: hypothetical protein R2761_13265 [Acidimicrobiales bacterium]